MCLCVCVSFHSYYVLFNMVYAAVAKINFLVFLSFNYVVSTMYLMSP